MSAPKGWKLNPEWVKLGPKADIHFLTANKPEIKKALKEDLKRRTIRVKSVLP